MRRILYYKRIVLALALLVVGTAQAQNGQISFESKEWNFGKIAEDGGMVEHTFLFSNPSSKPVVILDVTTSCGCTTPSYSRKPIMGGGKGEIVVSIDPMNRAGHFSKTVSVVTSASQEPVNLLVEGTITPRVKSLEEQYPFDIGGGVRLAANFHAFAYVGRGESISQKIGWVNTSDKSVELSFVAQQSSGLLKLDCPKLLPADTKGEMTIIYSVPSSSDKYGTLSDVFYIDVNGHRSRTSFSTHAIAVDKFDAANDDISSPIAELSKKFIKFGEVKRGKSVTDTTVELHNSGETDLIIRAIEWQSKALRCSLQSGDKVKAGGSVRLELTLDTTNCDYDIWVDRLRIITNDPQHPMHSLRITAIVVE